jgi:hypothetical protein
MRVVALSALTAAGDRIRRAGRAQHHPPSSGEYAKVVENLRGAWQKPQEVVSARTDRNELRQVDGKRPNRRVAAVRDAWFGWSVIIHRGTTGTL